jgi:TonB family protein
MSTHHQVNPFDLLGQEEPFPIAVSLRGAGQPNLSIAWNSFHQNFFSELAVFFRWTRVPKGTGDGTLFRDCRVQRNIPAKAITAAALWHVVFFIIPWPTLPGSAKHNPAFDNAELTWSGPIDDLPLLNVPKHAPKTARAKPSDPSTEGTDAYHPRQRIFTDPVRTTHPRQTLVRPSAPMEAPKFLPMLPNMVQLAETAAPARPQLEISQQTLAKLRPKLPKHVAATDTPPVDAPNLETRAAEMSLSPVQNQVEKPKLEINAGSAPRLADRNDKGQAVAAPELAAGTNGARETIIALSATPGPPAPVAEVPKGNLAAHMAMSPEGKGAGTGGGASNATVSSSTDSGATGGSAENSTGIRISGGSPKPNAVEAGSAPSGKLNLSTGHTTYKRPDANADPAERNGPPNFAVLPPGAQPEQIFSATRVYSMNVNMPNLNSVTGSWIIHFAELHLPGSQRVSGELSAPVPVRKVDPKYPLTAIQEHIEGEVILYGVIRPDGSVDSIQLVRGIDKELNANAVAAFAQWKFQPASKGGQPVPLEAIVHIPFRGPARD